VFPLPDVTGCTGKDSVSEKAMLLSKSPKNS
jgi:hypothetical protein